MDEYTTRFSIRSIEFIAANGYPHNLSEVTCVYFSLLVQEIRIQAEKYGKDGNVVGLLLVDIAWDTGEVINPLYKEAMPQAGIPVYPVVGNHDFDKAHRMSFNYEKDFGPMNYAFWAGKDLVVMLRNIFFIKKSCHRLFRC